MSVRAIVFDFDGLLVETEWPAYQAWCEVYAEHGCELPLERWLDYIGREAGHFDALAYLAERVATLDRDAAQAKRDARKSELIEALDLLPGVRERVAEAKARGSKVGIASSSTSRWVVGHLDRLAYREQFDVVTCLEPGMRAKPAPDLYLAALRDLGVEPHEAVAIEDSANGIAAAKAAGLRCVAVPNQLTSRMDLSAADLRLGSLAELDLESILARL